MPTINKPKTKSIKSINEKSLAQKLVYSTVRWQKLRFSKIQNNPLCESCFEKDIIKEASEVHHITPFMEGSNVESIKLLAFDYNNLMSLCNDCHHNKHKK